MTEAISAIMTVAGLALLIGLALGYAKSRLPVDDDPVVERINALLPQTQCAQCGYPGCRPYAEAVARGDTEINLCPPGGEQTVKALGDLLGRPPKPLAAGQTPALTAFIDEDLCIGCARCLSACPVDAIIGAPQQMHTVIAEHCTGCELCLPPCPVDCIKMWPASEARNQPSYPPGPRPGYASA